MEPEPTDRESGLPLPPESLDVDAVAEPDTEPDIWHRSPVAPAAPLPAAVDPVATARRRYGTGGAILAAGMLGIDKVLGRRVKEEAPIVIAASDQPVDIDTDGITVPLDDDTDVVAPPQPRPDPFPRRPRKRRR